MDLNIISFTYLFLRLAPFVLVSFFALSSIFNQDFKVLLYFVVLLCAFFINVAVGNVMTFLPTIDPENRPEICNMISLGQTDISKLPLGQAVFGYTFAYLLYTIIVNDFVNQNIPTLVFFPLVIVFDGLWNIKNSCYTVWQLLASLVFAGFGGWLWAYIIEQTNSTSLQYFAGVNNKEVCSKPSASKFKCAVYKNGKLLEKNLTTPTE
jgi:hypothetical protein